MPKISFNAFLKVLPISDDRIGDFVSDARRDICFPGRRDSEYHMVKDFSDLRRYLDHCNACSGAYDAAKDTWRLYKQYLRRKGA